MTLRGSSMRWNLIGAVLAALAPLTWLAPAPSAAQLATATLRGTVTQGGAPVAGAEIVAHDIDSGIDTLATADAHGRYVISGMRPANYQLRYQAPEGLTAVREASVSVGQSLNLDVDIPAAEVPTTAAPSEPAGTIVVTGQSLVETRTSETATNVTIRKIENLPQSSRNFLNFAELAPGVRSSNNETRKTFSSGGVGQDPNGESLASPQVNVFIDGVSLKSNVQQGGVVGQDSSRGNPFPQAAIQEFRVLSSNFKAEYEDAGTAVITAVTKSGGNDYHGEVFGFFQNKLLRTRDSFQKTKNLAEADYTRWQYGASVGGPILKDKLHFFGAYEGNDEDRTRNVVIGSATPENVARFGGYEGSSVSPFFEHLGFAKLSWDADAHNRIDLAGSLRNERETAGYGEQTAREAASLNHNAVYTGNLRWQYDAGDFMNEASVDYLYYGLKADPLNPDLVGQNFEGVVLIGGRGTRQRATQKGFTLRDAVTFSNIDFIEGSHIAKLGGKLSFQDYRVTNALNSTPVFDSKVDATQGLDLSFPYDAKYGVGNPTVRASDVQFGLFAQDDWELNEHLTFNIGLRWDYETNASNNDYVTSPEAAAALRELETKLEGMPNNSFRAKDYISTGKNRSPYWKAFQPRLGVSYDVFADQRTVAFAGLGRYFDRALFRNAAEETLLDQYEVRTFYFSRDGQPRNAQQTLLWNPDFLSASGLDALIDSGVAPAGELRVLRNDARPPHVDQLSVGVRQQIAFLNTAISYNHIEARDQVAYSPLNRSTVRNANGMLDTIPVTGYGTVVGLNQARASRYDGVFVTLDKPYSKASPWSVNLAYTLAFSRERGYAFNFDFPDIAKQPYRPNAGDERHRVVLAGLVDLPFDFQASALAIWGTGQPYLVTDAHQGYGDKLVIANTGNTKDFHQLDLRLTKSVKLWRSVELQFIAELFNVFNRANFLGYDGLISMEGNPTFGQPNSLSGPPRSFQFGMRGKF